MIENGIGGANTNKNGKYFENRIYKDLLIFLNDKKINKKLINNEEKYLKIYNSKKELGFIIKQHGLYKFLKDNNINWKEKICSRIIPDLLIINFINKEIIISEIKYQKVSGSTDEKLQTAHFKKYQYKKLFDDTKFSDFKIKYGYFLNNWFSHNRYNDILKYLENIECFYFFYDKDNYFKWKDFLNFNY